MQTTAGVEYPLPWEAEGELYGGFFRAMKEKKLYARKCCSCAAWQWPPRPFCRECQSTEFKWEEVPDHGTVYTYTVMYRAFSEYYTDKLPCGVVVVDVGPVRLPGRFLGHAEDIECGITVKAEFDEQALTGSSLAWVAR
ncbi:Zn-ribbon domain-containing OB-fold protein [Nesterenkonia muleiensis]|uniref:Zn-ribbon domain-containing OB-fold protein n=1 Tax=Nesterenkonia muleiensis TaxID=2282648 RepID=UPI000E74F269|nr:OB-fold domain-containing protein [Nesterenkonia muleiensis]